MSSKNIYEKLAAIRDRVSSIPKNGYNSYSNYKYVDKDTLYDYFRQYFAEHNLLVLTSEDSYERTERKNAKGEVLNVSSVRQKHTIINIDNTDERIELFSRGVGEDKTDKDAYQADTGAMKYFLIDNFFVSGGDSFPGDVEHNINEKTKQGNSKNTVQYGLKDIPSKPPEKKEVYPKQRIQNAKKYLEKSTGSDETFYAVLNSLGITKESEIKDSDLEKVVDALLSKTQEIIDTKEGK